MNSKSNTAQPCGLGQVFDLAGAGEKSRTPDLRITNALLYQLSYAGLGQNTNYSEGSTWLFRADQWPCDRERRCS